MTTKQDFFIEKIKAKCDMDNDCWIWKGRLNDGKPFTTISYDGIRENMAVRRVTYLCKHPDTQFNSADSIYTTCGNLMCVNPDHLAIGIGAGTQKGQKIAGILKRYKELLDTGEKWSIERASKELNISWTTLRKYLTLYEKDPAYWETVWQQL